MTSAGVKQGNEVPPRGEWHVHEADPSDATCGHRSTPVLVRRSQQAAKWHRAAPVAPAVKRELAAGRPVVLLSYASGGLLLAAEHISTESVAFAVRHGSGLLRVVMSDERAAALGLPLMWQGEAPGAPSRFTVSVDAAEGIGTGISAADRAVTIGRLADPATTRTQLRRPGHVLPVSATEGCGGYPAAVLDVLLSAGLRPVGAYTELVLEGDGDVANAMQLREFAARYSLPVVVYNGPLCQPAEARVPGWLLTAEDAWA